ncbi:MAG TPA: alpha/beta fold hydrolase [Dictyobacter sp.]|jgi:carboxylesterase|nr:alpha/beta fold hydrolase [Dictyobacter sp.]
MLRQDTTFWLGPENATKACLLIHGFMGGPAEMREAGTFLAQQGIRVYGMRVAGHSGNPEDLLPVNRQHWITSAEEGFAQIAHYPQVFVAGLSMGGILSLLLAIRHPEKIVGVIALSTPTHFTANWQTRIVPLARFFIKWHYPLAKLDLQDPQSQFMILQEARLRGINTKIDFADQRTIINLKREVRIPVPALAELFQLTHICRQQLRSLRTPLLIIHSRKDTIVNPACATELAQRTPHASPKRTYWLERSDHVITTGPERQIVFQQMQTFIDHIALHIDENTAPTQCEP